MKKIVYIVITILLLSVYLKLIAADTLTLSAVVGNSNHTPVVTQILPDLNPNYLSQSVIGGLVKENYMIKFRDDERDEVTYTITTETEGGAANPINGTVLTTEYDINNEAYINFEYVSPYSPVGPKNITVTISDGPNVTILPISVYIY